MTACRSMNLGGPTKGSAETTMQRLRLARKPSQRRAAEEDAVRGLCVPIHPANAAFEKIGYFATEHTLAILPEAAQGNIAQSECGIELDLRTGRGKIAARTQKTWLTFHNAPFPRRRSAVHPPRKARPATSRRRRCRRCAVDAPGRKPICAATRRQNVREALR